MKIKSRIVRLVKIKEIKRMFGQKNIKKWQENIIFCIGNEAVVI